MFQFNFLVENIHDAHATLNFLNDHILSLSTWHFILIQYHYVQTIHSTVEDTYIASIDTGRGPRETLRIFDTAGIQSSSQVLYII